MKKILALLIFLLPVFAQSQTCVISGSISDYTTSGIRWTVTLKEVRRAGYIMPVRDVPVLVANNGAFKFSVPQTVGTDTTKVRIFISDSRYEGEGKQGVWFAVPHGATATLATLVPVTFIAPSHVIAVPIATIVDSSGGSYSTDSLRLGSGLRAIAPTNGGGTPTIIATGSGTGDMLKADSNKATSGGFATVSFVYANAGTGGATDTTSLSYRINVNKDGIAGKSNADSVAQQITLLKNLIADKADADSIHSQLVILYNLLGGKGDSDSLSTAYSTAAAAIAKADSNALHAQKFAILNNQIAGLADGDSVSVQVLLIKNIIAALADADSVKLAFDRLGDRENADSTLIKVSLSLDSALTLAIRSLSSTKRIFAQTDSITFLGEAGDVIDLSLGNNFRGTLSQNDTLSFTNAVDGQVVQLCITNANNYTLAFTGVAWPAGTAPTITAVANKRSIISLLVSGGMLHGVSVLNY